MPDRQQEHGVTIERIERALLLLAYLIELDGDIHLPMYEKLEQELAALQKTENTKQRARQRLAPYIAKDDLKAIR